MKIKNKLPSEEGWVSVLKHAFLLEVSCGSENGVHYSGHTGYTINMTPW